MMKLVIPVLFTTAFLISVSGCKSQKDTAVLTHDSAQVSHIFDTSTPMFPEVDIIRDTLAPSVTMLATKNLKADSLVAFAKTLIGVPYKYASTNPVQGFDCSGFITYVFNYFRINVPRSSVQFTNVGTTVPKQVAMPGDLILFTGTDTTETVVGHMGIVVNNTDSLRFIHASSGRANGVVITALNDYYNTRFVKVIRVL